MEHGRGFEEGDIGFDFLDEVDAGEVEVGLAVGLECLFVVDDGRGPLFVVVVVGVGGGW